MRKFYLLLLALLVLFATPVFAANRTVVIIPGSATTPGGYDAAYNWMYEALENEVGDITGTGDTLRIEISASDGTWSGVTDTTPVDMDGWTCDVESGEYIEIIALDNGARNSNANRTWDYSAYTLYADSNIATFRIDNDAGVSAWVHMQHIQIGAPFSANFNRVLSFLDNVAGVTIDSCYIKQEDDVVGIDIADKSGNKAFIVNNIINGMTTGNDGIHIRDQGPDSVHIYNNTITGWTDGVQNSGMNDTVDVFNNVVFNNTDDFDIDGTMTINNCASNDGDGNNPVDLDTNGEAAAFTDWENGDFTIKDVNSDLYLAGTDRSADATVPADDIDENARPSGNVSIGAFENVTAGAAAPIRKPKLIIVQ